MTTAIYGSQYAATYRIVHYSVHSVREAVSRPKQYEELRYRIHATGIAQFEPSFWLPPGIILITIAEDTVTARGATQYGSTLKLDRGWL